jgi:tetratricopeptide (TPR) repeat protein
MQEPPDYAAAERVLRSVLERDPNMSDALNWLSTALTHLGREEQAFAVLQRAARIDPLHPTAVVNLANRYLERGDSVRAEAELVRMLEIQDTPYSVLVALRELYEDQGRLVAYYDVARAQLDHGNFEHLYTQVLSYLLVGDAEHARYWAERTAREHPDFPASRFMGTAVPAMQGDFAKATAELHHVLAGAEMRFEDMAPFAQVWLARLPALAGNCGEGVPLLESALRADEATLPAPDVIAGIVFWVDAWHTLAWCLQHDGQEARAQAILEALERGFVQETAEGRHPGSGVWFRGARNALLQGDTARAFTRLERAVELGWRSYYLEIHNPLLAPLREHPGFAQLMETVRVDIERQRQEIERRDAIQSLAAVYDARLARERAAERGGSVPAGARSDDSAVRMPRN